MTLNVCTNEKHSGNKAPEFQEGSPNLVPGTAPVKPLFRNPVLFLGFILALGWLCFGFILALFWLHFGTRVVDVLSDESRRKLSCVPAFLCPTGPDFCPGPGSLSVCLSVCLFVCLSVCCGSRSGSRRKSLQPISLFTWLRVSYPRLPPRLFVLAFLPFLVQGHGDR